MSKSDKFETELLEYIFNNTSIPLLTTDLYVALHTTPGPGEGGTQDINEADYGGYQRVQLTRADGTDWSVSGDTVNPVQAITFPIATSGNNTITHFSIGKGANGATDVLYHGTVTPNISVSTGVTPSLTEATAVTED